jgi:hypothetical protein
MYNVGTAVRENPRQDHVNISQSLETKSLRSTCSVQLISVTESWEENRATRRVMGLCCEFGCGTAEQKFLLRESGCSFDSAWTLPRLLLRKAPVARRIPALGAVFKVT